MTTVAGLARRIERLEADRNSGPLTTAELAELHRLQADFDAQFPGVRQDPAAINDLTDEQIEAYLRYESCGHGEPAQRMHELRMRSRTREQIEADRIHGEMIAAMSNADLEAWINASIHGEGAAIHSTAMANS